VFFACVLVSLAVSTDQSSETYGCSATLLGKFYDISSLNSTIDYTAPDSNSPPAYTYHFNPCGIVNGALGKCLAGKGTFCQVTEANPQISANLGTCSTDGATPPVWTLINNDPNAGVIITYNNGDSGCNTLRTGIIILYCGKGTGRGAVNGSVTENPLCVYTMSIISQAGCPFDACVSNPCMNGGTCAANGATFNCQCPPGYAGNSCETAFGACTSSPCINGGTCKEVANSFQCSCISPYSGVYCQTQVIVQTNDNKSALTAVAVVLTLIIVGLLAAVVFLYRRSNYKALE